MAELTQQIIDVVGAIKCDEDIKQDLYKHVLESDFDFTFDSKEHLNNWAHGCIRLLNINERRKEGNRTRLREENSEAIRAALGYTGTADSPLEIISADESLSIKLKLLSPLLRGTLEWMIGEGLTPEEVAHVEGTTENLIYQRIHQAKKLLEGDNK